MENHLFTQKVNGINIYYELFGDKSNKPVIVLVHGFLSSTFSFRRLIPLLEKDFTVLAIDLPPFGKSEKSTRFKHSYHNMSIIMIQLLEQLHISKAIFVGHSMGGQICMYAALQKPELVNGLVLLSSSGYLKRMAKPLIYSSYIPFFHLIVKRRLEQQGVEHNLLNVVYNHSLIDQEMINGYSEPFLDHRIFMALTRMIRQREGDLPPEDLHKIKTPALLIWGEKDKVVPVSIGKRLHQDLPNSIFIALENTGHLVPEERPEEVYTHILNFLCNQRMNLE
ncbi:alpha/beta fold hydrolase [Fredinandcohnia quinoae]|uniref:Alpha/beta hydrolase n=1 Tax=Fredinandcohnia quinoae TaxID=2918902 RepID=A0AAW5DYP2_9BACI|nr:alpha/beta hydrolase [Fredinandcohnia sp. SECRCQ15]MCH1625493.1 alpha/beta hydrolase [Fredinandcohnia sp. SECRCQ15]